MSAFLSFAVNATLVCYALAMLVLLWRLARHLRALLARMRRALSGAEPPQPA